MRNAGRWQRDISRSFVFLIFLLCIALLTPRNRRQLGSMMAKSSYKSSHIEEYFISMSHVLGFDKVEESSPKLCSFWLSPELTSIEFHSSLLSYLKDLEEYTSLVNTFTGPTDIRKLMQPGNDNLCCRELRLRDKTLEDIFISRQLSKTANGYIEPLLPPLRHPKFCLQGKDEILNLAYLVHDFEKLCETMTARSQIIFLDLGASPSFHRETTNPGNYLSQLFRKFGLPFDHIYAFEKKAHDPVKVYEIIPAELLASYHWINVGIDPDPTGKLNPLSSLLKTFKKEDVVVVKLDIDTPNLEKSYALQIMNDPILCSLIDHFYFEHHVFMQELLIPWKGTMNDSVAESLSLFTKIRECGVAAHYWV